MEVVGREAGAGERPLLLVPPAAPDEDPPLGRPARVPAAHHEDAHGCAALDPVVRALQPAVEPALAERVHVESRVGAELGVAGERHLLSAVRPRPDDQPVRATLGSAQLDVVEVRHRRPPRVVPAGHVVHGHVLVLGEMVDHGGSHVRPECVGVPVAHRLDQPLLVVGGEAQRGGAGTQRQRRHEVANAQAQLLEGRGGGRRRGGPQRRGAGIRPCARRHAGCPGSRARRVAEREDPVEPAQLERPVVPDAVAPAVAHRVDGHHRREVRGVGDRHRVLRAAGVRGANRADASVRPGLPADPCREVGAVRAVVAKRAPAALRAIAPAHVLHDRGVAARHEVPRPAVGDTVLVVGRALQDHRPAALQRLSVARREIDVRGEAHAVSHRDHDVRQDDDVVRRRRRGGLRVPERGARDDRRRQRARRRRRTGHPSLPHSFSPQRRRPRAGRLPSGLRTPASRPPGP